MTARKHLKQLVRARMQKTGESYVTARRHVLKSESPGAAEPHYPGSIPIATSLRILLAHAGVAAPHTGRPFSEAMTFGIGGGIGAGAFAFHYARENFSSFYIAGRHSWHDDVAWMKAACSRFSVDPAIRETSSSGGADKALKEALESGPVVAWVDMAMLPYRGLPAWMRGGGYHMLAVYDCADDVARVGDLADRPVEVAAKDLQAARARIKKQKNRLLSLPKSKRAVDLKSAIRGGVKACVEGLLKGRLRNFTLAAFRDWADRMHGSKAKDGWQAIFPPGPNLRRGLGSIHAFIEHWGTGGGLMRPMMAEFLEEAAGALDDPRYRSAAERYAKLGRDWSALAEAALPDDVPSLFEARERAQCRSERFLEELSAEPPEPETPFSISPGEADRLRRGLKDRILELCDGEEAALQELMRLAN